MRIGIIIKEGEDYPNWQLRLIDGIMNDPDLELQLLIKMGEVKGEGPVGFLRKFKSLLSSKQFFLVRLAFKLQIRIEEKVFFKEKQTVDLEKILLSLSKIRALYTQTRNHGNLNIFTEEEIGKIQDHNLDIVLKLCPQQIAGEILSMAKKGVWALAPVDFLARRNGPIGFWEVVNKEPIIGFSLLKLTNDPNFCMRIDSTGFNRHWSCVQTRHLVLEASVSVILKNIRRLLHSHSKLNKSNLYQEPPYRYPKLHNLLKYSFNFYYTLFRKIIERYINALFGFRAECWTIFIGNGDFFKSTFHNLKPVPLPKDEFWADPFLFKYKDLNYIFFENYSYKLKRGKISCGKIVDNMVIEVGDVLNFDYHLSFPFIFEEDGDIYLMPETSENKRLEIYKAVEFPYRWELFSTAFENEIVADAILYKDKKEQKWLFINKGIGSSSNVQNELYIYRIDSLNLKNISPHLQNPVLIDSRVARNAGAIFEYGNELFRPSQRNIDGIYGRALNINKIEKISIDEYVERTVRIFKPTFDKRLMAMHHLHQLNGQFVFDAAYKRKK